MNTKFVVFAFFSLSILFQSCIPSLHPLYTEDKLVLIEDLLGIWTADTLDVEDKKMKITINNDDGPHSETWSFEKGSNKNYKLIHSDTKGKAARFNVHVVKLGVHYFLDFYRADPEKSDFEKHNISFDPDRLNDLETFHLFPVHTFAKLEITDEHLKISMFDYEFVEKLFKEKRIRIKHENVDDHIVLTAQPEELQQFLSKYADEAEAFMDPTTLKRKF